MSDFNVPSLKELVYSQAEKNGDKTFIKFVRNGNICEKSYNDLKNDSDSICKYIKSVFGSKSHVAIVSKTNYEYIVCVTAIIMSGNVVVPFSPDISKDEAAQLFARADIDFLIYDKNFEETADYIKQNCKFIKLFKNLSDTDDFIDVCNSFSLNESFNCSESDDFDKDACCAIIFTSGTTGVKKGVMLSSNSLIGNIMYKDKCDVFNENETALSVLPMHHVYSFTGDYIKNLKDCVTLCLNENMGELFNNILLFQPHVMRVVPMIARHILQKIKFIQAKNPNLTARESAERIIGKNLRWLISGGAYLSPDIIDEFKKFSVKIRQGYGMTEAGCRISVPDEDVSPDSVGRVTDICNVRIFNGEIQVLTPTKMLGYYNMPKETAEMFTQDGWLKTGDVGIVTDDRQLFITGRVKNLIILSSGENVSPEAIEKKFSGLPIIQEVIVYAENNMIVAEIYPNEKFVYENNISNIKNEIEKIIDDLNIKAKSSHFISKFILRNTPFERTSSGKLKRKNTII